MLPRSFFYDIFKKCSTEKKKQCYYEQQYNSLFRRFHAGQKNTKRTKSTFLPLPSLRLLLLKSIVNRWMPENMLKPSLFSSSLLLSFGWHMKNHKPLWFTAVNVLLIKDLTDGFFFERKTLSARDFEQRAAFFFFLVNKLTTPLLFINKIFQIPFCSKALTLFVQLSYKINVLAFFFGKSKSIQFSFYDFISHLKPQQAQESQWHFIESEQKEFEGLFIIIFCAFKKIS